VKMPVVGEEQPPVFPEPRTPNPEPRRGAGFTLVELLVAMFVLALAVAGAVGVIVAAGRSATGAREKLIAEELSRTALADAAYTAEGIRAASGGALSFSPLPYSRQSYRTQGGATDMTYGWLWRSQSFDAATGAYSLDVWVFRNPAEPSVAWGGASDSDLKRQQTLLYLQSKLENRKP